ncbi:MAG TPA: pirin family protein [Steroidobacteraceae bacterium]|nr:pirin family protein [Steroidobacteraceae bacterium]
MRTVSQIIQSVPTSDGAGVKLRRSIGSQRGLYVDPFLMLDEFYSDDPQDYLAGFPSHPHRGFETVTYMLDGRMRHEDHLGNRGDLGPGDVQWMTAAGGIIHSEMPQQTQGRMRGFQLWLNLPAAEKMQPAHYRDIPAIEVPQRSLPSGGRIKLIAGTIELDGQAISGPVNGNDARLSTDPLYLDLELPAGGRVELPVPQGHNAFLYLYDGEARVGPPANSTMLPRAAAAVLGDGTTVRIEAGAGGARLLLLAARALHEPVVQYGPFVMNTREQIEQAVDDFRSGRFAAASTRAAVH